MAESDSVPEDLQDGLQDYFSAGTSDSEDSSAKVDPESSATAAKDLEPHGYKIDEDAILLRRSEFAELRASFLTFDEAFDAYAARDAAARKEACSSLAVELQAVHVQATFASGGKLEPLQRSRAIQKSGSIFLVPRLPLEGLAEDAAQRLREAKADADRCLGDITGEGNDTGDRIDALLHEMACAVRREIEAKFSLQPNTLTEGALLTTSASGDGSRDPNRETRISLPCVFKQRSEPFAESFERWTSRHRAPATKNCYQAFGASSPEKYKEEIGLLSRILGDPNVTTVVKDTLHKFENDAADLPFLRSLVSDPGSVAEADERRYFTKEELQYPHDEDLAQILCLDVSMSEKLYADAKALLSLPKSSDSFVSQFTCQHDNIYEVDFGRITFFCSDTMQDLEGDGRTNPEVLKLNFGKATWWHNYSCSAKSLRCAYSSGIATDISPGATSTPECRNTNAFSVLATRVGENVNAERYCFHECKPVQGWSQTPQGASCVSLTQGEVRQLTAAVLRPAPSPELAARSSRLHDPAALQLLATKRVGTELSSSASSNGSGDDVVAHAQKVAADTAADAAKSSAAAHAKVESRSGQDVDWSAGAGVVLAQMVHAAETEANEAVEAAGAAVKTMDESCDEVARASAVAAGDAAIASLATEEAAAAAKAAAYNARVASTPNAKAKVAMEKAAKPFFDQMTQAQGTARDYVTVADKKAGDAAVAEGEARELENQANAANARGERCGAVAESLIGQAKSKWAAGQRLAKKAEELRSQAQDINKLVPQYQHAGTVAGALAAQAANPNFVAPPHILPPPPPDPMASWAGPDPMAEFRRSPP
eukprot:g12790.t1